MKTRTYNDTLDEGWQLRVSGKNSNGEVEFRTSNGCGQGIAVTISRRSQHALIAALAMNLAEHEERK